MAILGIDVGYAYTKTSEGIIFPSKITEADPFSKGDKIVAGDKEYIIGAGAGSYDINKTDSEVFKICLMAAIVKSTEDDEVKIVIGLPVGQYQDQKHELELMLEKMQNFEVSYNGKDRKIKITDFIVYAQGAAALYSQQINGDAIICDIGGITTDIALFRVENGARRCVKHSTVFKSGTLTLYSDLIQAINGKLELSLDPSYAENILKDGLVVNGEKADLEFIKPIIATHIKNITEELSLNYPEAKIIPIYLCGGGAELLGNIVKKKFPMCQHMNNGQFANANGFKKVGQAKWQ